MCLHVCVCVCVLLAASAFLTFLCLKGVLAKCWLSDRLKGCPLKGVGGGKHQRRALARLLFVWLSPGMPSKLCTVPASLATDHREVTSVCVGC